MPNDELYQKLVSRYGQQGALEQLAKLAGYKSLPVDITTFIDDPYYAGSFLGKNLYPAWRGVLQQIFPLSVGSNYLEIALTGAIGIGKSSVALAGILYDLMRLCHLESPHRTYKLIDSTPIWIAFFNTTLKNSDSVLVSQFKDFLSSSPYFRDLRSQVSNPRKELLPHKISLLSGSRGSHGLGRAVVSACLSELNFAGEYQKNQAYESYVLTKRRMESRFMKGENFLAPGRAWLDSSKSDEMGFLEQHIKGLQSDPKSLVVCKAIYDVLGPAGKVQYSGDTFRVFIGDQNRDPMLLDSFPGATYNIAEDLIIHPPVEYQQSFERDIYGALRDIAGISTWSSHKFIAQASFVKTALAFPNPCYKTVVELDFDENTDRLIDYIDLSALDKKAEYFLAFDLGLKKDRTGIALTRCLGEIEVEKISETFESRLEKDSLFQTDLVIAVSPVPGKEVPISKLKNFVINLTHAGINISHVSADGYQSANLLQDLSRLGRATEVISVDRTRDAYDYWKNCVLEGRWKGPQHDILERETLGLLDLGKKIDHPPPDKSDRASQPSKDLTDAVAQSLFNCYQKNSGSKTVVALEGYFEHLKKVEEAEKRDVEREQLHEIMELKRKTDPKSWWKGQSVQFPFG